MYFLKVIKKKAKTAFLFAASVRRLCLLVLRRRRGVVMDTLSFVADLRNDMGEVAFRHGLLNPGHREAISNLIKKLIKDSFPDTITVGGHTYKVVNPFVGEEGDRPRNGRDLFEWAKNICPAEDLDLEQYQDGIDARLRGATIVFPNNWCTDGNTEFFLCCCHDGSRWVSSWQEVSADCSGFERVLELADQ